jgi:hypothetical protein
MNTPDPPIYTPADGWISARPAVIRLSDVRPGDMLLHVGRNKPMPTLIKAATGSPYTHASMYLGDAQGGEATWPDGVRKYTLKVPKTGHIAVFRSQCGFNAGRVQALREFIDELISQKTQYDLKVCNIWKIRKDQISHELKQIETLEAYFNHGTKPEPYGADGYFCSALVVSCYFALEVLGESMACVDRPELHLPEELGHNVDFGHIVGYLAPADYKIPADDPFANNSPFHSMWP